MKVKIMTVILFRVNNAFKLDFPEITDSRKRGNRLGAIKRKIAKIKAESDGLNAAVSANAGASASGIMGEMIIGMNQADKI